MECKRCGGDHNEDYHEIVEVSRSSFITPEYRVDLVEEVFEDEQYVDIELVPWSLHYRGEGEAIRLGFTEEGFEDFFSAAQELKKK